MATSTFPAQGGTVDNTSAASFIPEIWSDEVVAAYKSNLVLAPLVKKMSMTGKKGDTIHIPKPVRGSANAKVANTAVTIQNNVESEVIVSINKHFEFSRMIEDITNVQAHATLRAFYTGDAGYGLAKQIDSDLFDLSKSFGDGNGASYATSASYFVDASTNNGLTEYEVDTVAGGNVFTDAGFRAAIQKLDDEDVPMDGRSFVVPPVLRNTLMGIDRYVSSDFVSGGVVAHGKIGNLYGTDLYISTNCPTLESAAENSAGGAIRGALMFHKEAMILAEQTAVRSQQQYKQEFLATLYTADTIYGTKVIRPESGLLIAVNG